MTQQQENDAISDPYSQELAFLTALKDNLKLADIQQQQLAQDELILSAFNNVPAPSSDHLQKLLDTSEQPQTKKHSWSPVSYVALAASVILSVIGVQFLGVNDTGHNPSLSLYALEHTAHGQHHAGIENTHPQLSNVNYQLATYGAQIKNTGSLIWNKDCDFGGIIGAHLVYQHSDERVNVYIVPDSYKFEQVHEVFNNEYYQGTIKKIDNNYLIIIAPKGMSDKPFIEKIDEDIIWQA